MKSSCITLVKVLIAAIPFIFFTACEKTDNYMDWKDMNTAWYKKNKEADGFKVTESGLSYKRISPKGNSDEGSPNQRDYVIVKYTGKYIDGTQFDSDSTGMYLSSTVSGFREGLLKMTVGETYQFYIPYQIGYGTTKSGAIPPYTTLIFEVKLIKTLATTTN